MVGLVNNELQIEYIREPDIPNYGLNATMPMCTLEAPTKEYIKTDILTNLKVNKESETDILVVGAGPVGLILCIQLARLGMLGRFKLLDNRAEVENYARAMLFHARTLEIFNQIGLFERVQNNPHYEKADELGYASFYKGEPKYNMRLPLPTNCSINHQMGLYQSELEKEMVAYLAEIFDFQVQRNSECIQLEHNKDSGMVEAALFEDKLTGEIERVKCKYLVGADGGRSHIRKQHGFEFQGYSYDGILALLDLDLDFAKSVVPKDLKVVNAFWQDKYSLVWVKPRDTARFVMFYPGLQASESLTQEDYLDVINEIIHPYFVHPKAFLRFSKTNANERIVSQMYRGNVFLVGDAAHVHSPAGGMGSNLGMQDAYNLAFKLHLIHSAKVDKDKVAQSYHLERREEAKRVLAYSGKILRTNMTPNSFMDMNEIRIEASNDGFGSESDRQTMSENIAMTEYIYPPNPLLHSSVSKSDEVSAILGKRFPHTIIYKNEKYTSISLISMLSGVHFEIFVYHPDVASNNKVSLNLDANYSKLDNLTKKLNGMGVPVKWNPIAYTNSHAGDDEGIGFEEEVEQPTGLIDLNFELFQHFGLKYNDQGQIFVIRPDGHLALSQTLLVDENVELEPFILDYFKNFVLL